MYSIELIEQDTGNRSISSHPPAANKSSQNGSALNFPTICYSTKNPDADAAPSNGRHGPAERIEVRQ